MKRVNQDMIHVIVQEFPLCMHISAVCLNYLVGAFKFAKPCVIWPLAKTGATFQIGGWSAGGWRAGGPTM